MSKSRLEWKVGVFVFIGLVLLAVLMLGFSKGLTFFRPTYDIYLRSANVGGLKTRAGVLMSGVQVGTVSDIRLAPSGKTVTITLRIYREYQIHKDAIFSIQQSGFLGDNYVAIMPTDNQGEAFRDQDYAEAEAPFNLQEFTRSASGFISRIDETVKKLNEALGNFSRVVLNPQTLTNLAQSIANLRDFSQRALIASDHLNLILATNGPAIASSSSNLLVFSEQLNQFGSGLNSVLATNAPWVNTVVKNVESSSESLKSLLSDVQAGQGLAGELLKNEQTAMSVSQIVNNLSITTSNLNRLGLWKLLWEHKTPRTNAPAPQILASPKNAHD